MMNISEGVMGSGSTKQVNPDAPRPAGPQGSGGQTIKEICIRDHSKQLYILEKIGVNTMRSGSSYADSPDAVRTYIDDYMAETGDFWADSESINIRRATPQEVLREIFMGDRMACPKEIVTACDEDDTTLLPAPAESEQS